MASMWQFDDNGLVKQGGLSAPTYNDVFTKFGGQEYMTGYDPALAMTGSAGNQGQLNSGIGAFLTPTRNAMQGSTNEDGTTRSLYDQGEMQDLAKRFGVDPASGDLEGALNAKLGDYYGIGGMSAGWNPTGDARQGNYTLYQRQDGKLVPIQTQGGHLREQGNFVQEHPGVLAPFAVLGAGALATGLGAGAAASGGGVAEGAGAAAAGSTGGIGSGVGSAFSNLQALYAGLPGWGQGALTGAAQGGLSSGLQGKNILRGALMGGLTGGVGAVGGQFLSGATGMPLWAGRAATSAGLGGLTGGWKGALGAGLGSLAATGFGEMGLPSQLGGKLGGYLGNLGAGEIFGSGAGGGAGGARGGSGGGSGGGGSASAPGGSGGLAGGTTGVGSLGGPQLGAAKAQELAFLRDSYAPIAAEEQRRKLAEKLGDDLV